MDEIEEITNDWEDFKKDIDEQIKALNIKGNLYISWIDCGGSGRVSIDTDMRYDNGTYIYIS